MTPPEISWFEHTVNVSPASLPSSSLIIVLVASLKSESDMSSWVRTEDRVASEALVDRIASEALELRGTSKFSFRSSRTERHI